MKVELLFCRFQAHGLSQASLIPFYVDVRWNNTMKNYPKILFPIAEVICTESLPSFYIKFD